MSPMAKVDLPFVQAMTDRHGKRRYYFRRHGYKRITLPGEPGSQKFAKAYEEALASMKPAATSVREGPRSMGAAIAEYYLSSDFKAMQPSTQKGYRNVLEKFRGEYGCDMAMHFKTVHLNAIFHGMANTPAQASNLRKRLKAVFEIVVGLGWIEENPVGKTKRVKYRTKGFIPWTADDIAAYRKRWPSGTRERLALELLLYTGVRRSDVVLLGRQHVADGTISVMQEKTDERVSMPLQAALLTEIKAAGPGMTFILTQYGKPFTPAGFTQWFRERAEMAGLTGKTPHGVRKALGRMLAEAGGSDLEIAAGLGHSSSATVGVYTKDVHRAKLAKSAMAKLTEAGS